PVLLRLPSFPTRRSSDLAGACRFAQQVLGVVKTGFDALHELLFFILQAICVCSCHYQLLQVNTERKLVTVILMDSQAGLTVKAIPAMSLLPANRRRFERLVVS